MPAVVSCPIDPAIGQLGDAIGEPDVIQPTPLKALRRLPDPRCRRGRRHTVGAIVAIAVCAIVAGAKSFVAIAQWAKGADPGQLVAHVQQLASVLPAIVAMVTGWVAGIFVGTGYVELSGNVAGGNGLDQFPIFAFGVYCLTESVLFVVITIPTNFLARRRGAQIWHEPILRAV